MQLYMFERIGKDKIEDSPKKACARAGLLAEVDLPQVAPTCIFFLCFVLFSFRRFLLSLNPWPFVQSFFDMHDAPTATRS